MLPYMRSTWLFMKPDDPIDDGIAHVCARILWSKREAPRLRVKVFPTPRASSTKQKRYAERMTSSEVTVLLCWCWTQDRHDDFTGTRPER